jgi:hypothetical protein
LDVSSDLECSFNVSVESEVILDHTQFYEASAFSI